MTDRFLGLNKQKQMRGMLYVVLAVVESDESENLSLTSEKI